MRQIVLTLPNTAEWKDWRRRCDDATKALIAAVRVGGPVSINQELYSEFKSTFYMNYDHPFRGKCAYCERDVHNQYGDIEHFRPKGRVTGLDNKIIEKIVANKPVAHPGYYWLAYDVNNLLISCIRCNRPSSSFSTKTIGKWDKFPVEGAYAWVPGKESIEKPLLINPTVDDPNDHIIFDRSGFLGFRTKKGDITIKLLGLNEYSLPDRRKEKYDSVRDIFSQYLNCYNQDKLSRKTNEYEGRIKKIVNGYEDFTTYGIMAINDVIEEVKKACEVPFTP